MLASVRKENKYHPDYPEGIALARVKPEHERKPAKGKHREKDYSENYEASPVMHHQHEKSHDEYRVDQPDDRYGRQEHGRLTPKTDLPPW